MTPAILRGDPGAELATAENCRILERSNTPQDPTVSIARARVAPGSRFSNFF